MVEKLVDSLKGMKRLYDDEHKVAQAARNRLQGLKDEEVIDALENDKT
jgi:hypothetical protein